MRSISNSIHFQHSTWSDLYCNFHKINQSLRRKKKRNYEQKHEPRFRYSYCLLMCLCFNVVFHHINFQTNLICEVSFTSLTSISKPFYGHSVNFQLFQCGNILFLLLISMAKFNHYCHILITINSN